MLSNKEELTLERFQELLNSKIIFDKEIAEKLNLFVASLEAKEHTTYFLAITIKK